MGYTVNPDGSVTRDRIPTKNKGTNYSGGPNNSNGSDNNSGCWIIVVVAIIIGCIFGNKKSSNDNSDIEYEDAVATTVGNVTGSITKVWTEHNAYQNNTYGMRIHVKFNVYNMLNRTGSCAAYFHFSDGTPLNDYNGKYKTSDGKVSVGKNFTPNYQNCTFNDLQLFIPYSELHMGVSASLYYMVVIWDGQKEIARSCKYSFNYNKN